MIKKLLIILVLIAVTHTIYSQPGTIDLTFNSGIGVGGTVRTTAIQNDGKIIIGGNFTAYNGVVRYYIARLNVDGTLDSSFNPENILNGSVETISIQNDGKIIVGGSFNHGWNWPNTILIKYIVRLNADGSYDSSFNTGSGANVTVNTSCIQNDGKIIIGGIFYEYNGAQVNRLIRLNVDGSLDASFNSGIGINSSSVINSASIQSDEKIIIAGTFSSFNDFERNGIARLNVDGTLDNTFNPETGTGVRILEFAIQNDGKIIIGGIINNNGIFPNLFARLNPDGTLDSTFNMGTGFNTFSSIRTISIQNDGKIIVGGDISTYNGITRNGIARLNSDGTLDDTFNPGIGASTIQSTSIQNDGKIIIGGTFNSYDGSGVGRIARINGGEQLTTSDFEDDEILVYPNPSKGKFNVKVKNISESNKIIIYNAVGQIVFDKTFSTNESLIDISNQQQGIYFYKVFEDFNEVKSGKLILN